MFTFRLHSTSDDQQVIQVTKVNRNVKKDPESLKNEMLIFGLHSTSDDWISNPNNEI